MATISPTAIAVDPLDAPLGARITGIDLSRPLDAAALAAITRAWHRHIVLLFPDQHFDAGQQLAFARNFGSIRSRSRPTERRPEADGRDYDGALMFISNIVEDGKPLGSLPDGEMWFHHDGIHAEKPQRATFLYAIELPVAGGNTRFANMYAAYDHVPAELKKTLAGRSALNVYDFEMRERFDVAKGLDNVKHFTHPVFITHPATGRKALYVDRLMTARIEGLPKGESDAILDALFAIGEDASVVYEHVWTVDDFVMWDNLGSMHARTDFPAGERRLLRRCVIEGGRPVA